MRLSIKIINSYADINHFSYSEQWQVRPGEEYSLYFQLVDEDQESIRYMPLSVGPSVSITFPSLGGNLAKLGTIVDSRDPSIWKVDILETDSVSTGGIKISLTENAKTKSAWVYDAVLVDPVNPGQTSKCGCGGGCGGEC